MILRETQAGARLSARNADGTFPVVIVTEGEGSTGVYPARLMNEASAAAFENVGSHPNHPADPQKPQQRNPMGLIGRVVDVRRGEDRGKRALTGRFKPGSPEVAAYVEQFADLLAISIYARGIFASRSDDGKPIIESFDASWPYRSVDVVLAAGAGGRFALARESLLAIESATGAASPTARGGRDFSITRFATAAAVERHASADPDPGVVHSFAVHVSPLRNY